jgi:hypothetical protein
MYTAARRSADPARVDDAAHRAIAARAAPPPAAQTGGVADGAVVAAGATARGDTLGPILARAVAQRAAGGSGLARPAGATLQRFLGLGKKKKKPPRPTQAVPPAKTVTFGGEEAIPRHKPPTQATPKSPDAVEERVRRLAGGNFFVPGVVPQTPSPFEARQFDMDPFEAREFNLEQEAPAPAPPPPAMQPDAAATDAPVDDGFAPELVPDASGLIPVAGNPSLEWLVSSYASDRGTITGPRSYGALRNLQVIASLSGYPKPRPIDPRYLAASSTMRDWGFEY